jgi:hypothetical protein
VSQVTAHPAIRVKVAEPRAEGKAHVVPGTNRDVALRRSVSYAERTAVSSLMLLGSLGTTLSTFVMVPHLTTALRAGRPAGTPFAWGLGAVSGTVWLAYGFLVGDLLMAAPGFVTVPIGVVLTVWSHLATVAERRDVALLDELYAASTAPSPMVPFQHDTLEMPRIAA